MNGCQESQMLDDAPAVNPITLIGKKRCQKCKETKELSEFYRNKMTGDGFQYICRLCANEAKRKWSSKHRPILAERNKEWRDKNSDYIRIKNKEWRSRNKEYINAKNKDYQKENYEKCRKYRQKADAKRRSTPMGKLNNNLSRAIGKTLRGSKNGTDWYVLVGYNAEKLKKHLEKQFTSELSWDNYGTYWHIDHVVPKAAFNFNRPEDIDFKRCWSLKNLQPLKAAENRHKYDHVDKPFQPSLTI